MKIRTSDLTDIALDWAVCEATGLLAAYPRVRKDFALQWPGPGNGHLHPSTDWAQGGPIVEREKIGVWWDGVWHAKYDGCRPDQVQDAYTPLIAAMRCLVASKLGDTVDIPEELCQ